MRILLVNPPTGFSYGVLGIMRPPLGLAYMASILRNRHDVEIVDFSVDKRRWETFPYGEFDIVGISSDTTRIDLALKIADAAKARGSITVMGGPHVSFLDGEALESGVVDYVVRNEGEYSFASLVDFLDGRTGFENLQGVSCLEDGRLRRAPDAPFIHRLDSLPFPARDMLHLDLYKERMDGRLSTTMVSSRGCPFNCDFCSSSEFFGVAWRPRSAGNILEEMDELYTDYGYRAVSFVDDNFTLNPDRAVEVSELILEKKWDVIWSAMTRVDTIVKHPEMIRTMARAGFRWTFIGFEAGSQESLDAYGKKAVVGDAFRAMEMLTENRVKVTGAFILGAPHETEEMMRQTVDFAKRLNPRRAQFSMLTPYPGSNLFEVSKPRSLARAWEYYSGVHPTIRLDHVTSAELRRIHCRAYLSFYGRPMKAMENFSYIVKVLARLSAYFGSRLLTLPSKPILHTAVFARRCLARAHGLLSFI
jgi:anaerobic magnesium-protoporphyrin IX monomethyl ester cyclase